MVNIETVLVLGAGASWDYGFPTGQELVQDICDIAFDQHGSDYNLITGWHKPTIGPLAQQFFEYLKRAKPCSVDAWLEHNPKYIEVGKVAIAIKLLQYEKQSLEKGLRKNAAGDWYQLLFDRLNTPFDKFHENKIGIVTFNYDRSLEDALFQMFIYTHTDKEEKAEEFNQIPIVHVYGSLGRLEWQPEDPDNSTEAVPYGSKVNLCYVQRAAKSIKIVPEEQNQLTEEFERARELIAKAKALYFLGFGYNETNMTRLGIDVLKKPVKVMGTAYNLSYQRTREVEGHRIRQLNGDRGLFQSPVYEFLHKYVNFNENGYPKIYTKIYQ